MNEILIFGAGKRVLDELIPSLLSGGVMEKDIVLVRKQNQNLPKYPKIRVLTQTNEIISTFKGKIIFCCVPVNQQITLIERLFNLPTPKLIFFDTPVKDVYASLKNLANIHDLYVLEETALIPWIPEMRKILSGRNVLIFWRVFYNYHGVAFIRALSSKYMVKRFQLPFGKRIYVSRAKGSVILVAGYHRKEKSKCFHLHLPLINLISPFNMQRQGKSLENLMSDKALNFLSEMNLKSYSDFKSRSVFKDFDRWKFLALQIGIFELIDSSKILFPRLEDAVINELV